METTKTHQQALRYRMIRETEMFLEFKLASRRIAESAIAERDAKKRAVTVAVPMSHGASSEVAFVLG